jgi:hypothetical protein
MIKEITKYIADGVNGLILGTNIFPGAFHANCPDSCVAVIETPAGDVSFYLPDYAGKVVQVVVRDAEYLAAHDRAKEIFDLLHGMAGIDLPVIDGGTQYLANVIEAMTPPGSIGQDERGLHEFVTNFVFRIQEK